MTKIDGKRFRKAPPDEVRDYFLMKAIKKFRAALKKKKEKK